MIFFGVETEDREEITRYFQDTKRKLAGGNFLKNPFIGDICWFPREGKKTYILGLNCIYPRFYWFTALICVGIFFMAVWTPWILLPGGVTMLAVFWTRLPIMIAIYFAIRKVSPKARVRFLSARQAGYILLKVYIAKCIMDNIETREREK
jgi:hypothetical protein